MLFGLMAVVINLTKIIYITKYQISYKKTSVPNKWHGGFLHFTVVSTIKYRYAFLALLVRLGLSGGGAICNSAYFAFTRSEKSVKMFIKLINAS